MVALNSGAMQILVSAALLVLQICGAAAWGYDGHVYVCAIAQGLLTDEAKAGVQALLPDWAEGYMPKVCPWADFIGHTVPEWRWSLPLHYVDTPDSACTYDFTRDCHLKCCVSAILNYTSQLDSFSGQQQRPTLGGLPEQLPLLEGRLQAQKQLLAALTAPLAPEGHGEQDGGALPVVGPRGSAWMEEGARTALLKGKSENPDPSVLDPSVALMFLAHFVGDIHQPLHVGFTSDYGGNRIKVHWYKKKTNLHEVWDTEIIKHGVFEYYSNNPTEFLLAMAKRLSGEWASKIADWVACDNGPVCPNRFAVESIKDACQWAYSDVATGDTLGDAYFQSRFPVVELKLAEAGVRLAATLNRLFMKAQPGDPATLIGTI